LLSPHLFFASTKANGYLRQEYLIDCDRKNLFHQLVPTESSAYTIPTSPALTKIINAPHQNIGRQTDGTEGKTSGIKSPPANDGYRVFKTLLNIAIGESK
jgi:hypothetical protein